MWRMVRGKKVAQSSRTQVSSVSAVHVSWPLYIPLYSIYIPNCLQLLIFTVNLFSFEVGGG